MLLVLLKYKKLGDIMREAGMKIVFKKTIKISYKEFELLVNYQLKDLAEEIEISEGFYSKCQVKNERCYI